MMLGRVICVVLLLLLLGGCEYVQVQSSQLMSIKNTLFSHQSKEILNSQWQLQYGGYFNDVQPVTVQKNTVFVNKATDVVTFDGWKVTRVMGLKSFLPAWDIQDVGHERRFLVKGDLVATHYCDDWVRREIVTGVRLEQSCRANQNYTNILLIDNLGMIESITQVVDSSLMPLQLRLKN